jgi:hypothetical protein
VTWQDLLTHIYHTPSWSTDWIENYYVVPFIIAIILTLLCLVLFGQRATEDNPKKSAIGKVAPFLDRLENKVSRGLLDYRFVALFVTFLGTLALGIMALLYRRPERLLNDLGAQAVGDLSPQGVDLVLGSLQVFHTVNWLWVAICLLNAYIIWLDPHGVRSLTLMPPIKSGSRTFQDRNGKPMVWQGGEKRKFRTGAAWFTVDGETCSEYPPSNCCGWVNYRITPKGPRVLNGPHGSDMFAPGEMFKVGQYEYEFVKKRWL